MGPIISYLPILSGLVGVALAGSLKGAPRVGDDLVKQRGEFWKEQAELAAQYQTLPEAERPRFLAIWNESRSKLHAKLGAVSRDDRRSLAERVLAKTFQADISESLADSEQCILELKAAIALAGNRPEADLIFRDHWVSSMRSSYLAEPAARAYPQAKASYALMELTQRSVRGVSVTDLQAFIQRFPKTAAAARARKWRAHLNRLQVGSPAPNLDAGPQGAAFTPISKLRGKVVVIDFWGWWCGGCVEELPLYQKLAEEFPDRFVRIGVNFEKQPESMAVKQIQEYGLKGFHVTDRTVVRKLAHDWNIWFYPTAIVIDQKGVIRHVSTLENLAWEPVARRLLTQKRGPGSGERPRTGQAKYNRICGYTSLGFTSNRPGIPRRNRHPHRGRPWHRRGLF